MLKRLPKRQPFRLIRFFLHPFAGIFHILSKTFHGLAGCQGNGTESNGQNNQELFHDLFSLVSFLTFDFSFVALIAPHFYKEQGDSNGNRRVGNVKRWVVMLLPEKIKKVNNLTESNPVNQVAERAGKNQGEGNNREPLVLSDAFYVPENTEYGNDRHGYEKRDADRVVRQDAKGRALVADISKMEKAPDDGNRFMQPEMSIDVQLGRLVDRDND